MEELKEKSLIKSLIVENTKKDRFDIDKFIVDLQIFIEENGRYPSSKSSNEKERKLGGCVGNLRLAKKGLEGGYRLTVSMIQKLDAIGFVWDAKKVLDVDQFIKDLNNFIKLNNRYPIYKSSDNAEKKLASKVYMLRNARKGKGTTLLTEDRIKKLDSIGFVWDAKRLMDIDKIIKELQDFITKYGKYPTTYTEDAEEKRLAYTISNLRQAKKGLKTALLDETRIKKLDSIGFIWDAQNIFDLEEFINNLLSFIEKCNRYPLQSAENKNERKLANQVNSLRMAKKGNRTTTKLTEEMTKRLDEIGFIWDAQKLLDIDEFINNLLGFIKKHNRYPIRNSKDPNEIKLAGQVKALRITKKGQGTNRLTNEMIQKLNAIGFVWEARRGRPKKQEEESIMQK